MWTTKKNKRSWFIPCFIHFYFISFHLFIIYNMLDILTFLKPWIWLFMWNRKRSPVNKSKSQWERECIKTTNIFLNYNIVARTIITFNPVPTFVFSAFFNPAKSFKFTLYIIISMSRAWVNYYQTIYCFDKFVYRVWYFIFWIFETLVLFVNKPNHLLWYCSFLN